MSSESGSGSAPDKFLCGVVEGFYNRPWTRGQRLDLFSKMRNLGLNAYLYAPKDDHKHRALWREPYNEAEREELKALLDACRDRGVQFFYGISPGLDMEYSSERDAADLRAKCDALRDLGCEAFALLWDDIDTTLPKADRGAFNTLAEAHAKVTNELFHHLGRPQFLTCPVEYCSNRANPCVAKSEYLGTLGSSLHPDIGVFWTGGKVVSETIGVDELVQLGKVLRRKPVIWENLHANDYDHQRMFLGPYSGRDPSIIPHLRGVMTNPNCEYSLNVPAMFTLVAWSHCYDIATGEVTSWNPLNASELAIPHFMEETKRRTNISVHEQINADGSVLDSGGGGGNSSIEKEMELTKSDIELLFHLFWLPHSHGPKGDMLVNEFKYLRDTAHVMANYDVDFMDDEDIGEERLVDGDGGDDSGSSSGGAKDEQMATPASSSSTSPAAAATNQSPRSGPPPLLHFQQQDFAETWIQRASSFNNVCNRYSRMCDKFTFIANRELFFDINSYLNNLQVMLQGCNRYLKWVGLDKCRKAILGGPTLAGLPGGIVGDLQRLYPIRTNFEYPLRQLTPVVERDSYVCQPVVTPGDRKALRAGFMRLHCDAVGLAEEDLTDDEKRFVVGAKLDAFLSQPDAKILVLDSEEVLGGCLIGSRSVEAVCKLLKEHYKPSFTTAVNGKSSPSSALPWTLMQKYDAIMAYSSVSELFFTRLTESLFKLMSLALGGPNSACLIVERDACIMRQCLTTPPMKFREVHRGERFGVLAYDEEEDEEEEDMEQS